MGPPLRTKQSLRGRIAPEARFLPVEALSFHAETRLPFIRVNRYRGCGTRPDSLFLPPTKDPIYLEAPAAFVYSKTTSLSTGYRMGTQ